MPRSSQPIAISPRVTVAGQPDVSSLVALFAGPPFAGLQGETRAIAVWKFLCDRLYHYCAPAETEYGHNFIYDPLLLLNGFGFTICGVTANTLGQMFQAAGFPARVAFIRGHEGSEVFYDGRWHFFDSDLQAFHRRHAPEQHIVASREDCFRDPTIVSQQKNPSKPYYIPDRDPVSVAKLFEETPRYEFVLGEQSHSMDYVLRPGESIERRWKNDGRWICFDSYPETFKRFPKEPGAGGPRDRFDAMRTYGNGRWVYRLDLRKGGKDFDQAGQVEGTVRRGRKSLFVTGGERGCVVIGFDCPYPFAGIPDPNFAQPPRDGVKVRLQVARKTGAEEIALLIRGNKTQAWRQVASIPAGPTTAATGTMAWEVDVTPEIAGHQRFELGVALAGGGDGGRAELAGFEFEGWFVCAPEALPALQKGDNRLQFSYGDRFGLLSVKNNFQARFDEKTDFETGTLRLENGVPVPGTPELLRPAGEKPYSVVVPMSAPAGRRIAWFYCMAHVQARAVGAVDDGGVRLELAASEDGPWKLLRHFPLEAHPERWHFTVEHTEMLNAPAQNLFVRLSTRAGLLGFRGRFHHVAEKQQPSAPVEMVLRWNEGGRVREKHAVLKNSGAEISIRCAQDPQMESVCFTVGKSR